MGSISKSYGYDVGKGGDPAKPRLSTYKGERRPEKTPKGVWERFVDLQGNVVGVQLVPPGVPPTQEAITRARQTHHAMKNNDGTVGGFVEHGKCPIRHGARHRNELIESEFAEMPQELQAPCDADPAPSTAWRGPGGQRIVNHGDGCKHIEWLIKARQEREQLRLKSRHEARLSSTEIERRMLQAAQAQVEEQRKTNEKLVEVISQSRGGRKAQTE